MEAVYKELLTIYGPLGLFAVAFFYLLYERMKEGRAISDTKALKEIIEDYREVVTENTRTIREMADRDHVDNIEMARVLSHLATLMDERTRPRGRGGL